MFQDIFLFSTDYSQKQWTEMKANEKQADSVPEHFLWLDKFLISCLWLYLCIQNSMLHVLIFEKAHLEKWP